MGPCVVLRVGERVSAVRRRGLVARVLVLAIALGGGSVGCSGRILVLLWGNILCRMLLLRLSTVVQSAVRIRVRARRHHGGGTRKVVRAVVGVGVVGGADLHGGLLVLLEILFLLFVALTGAALHHFHDDEDDD